MNAKGLSFLTIFIIVIVGIWYFINTANDPKITFTPQQMKLYKIDGKNENPLDILATTLPQFAVALADQKFEKVWKAEAAERKSYVESSVGNAKGDVELSVDTKFDDKSKELVVTPKTENKLKPGLYKLNVKVKTVKGEDITITQDFTWGVLAINTNKGIYLVGEDVKIGMAVLDDFGSTKCIAKEGKVVYGTAKIWLTIKSPTGKTEKLSTEDGTIKGSKSCADRSITNDGDFLTQVKAEEEGKYEVQMVAENMFGKRSMDYHFKVQNNTPYDIERTEYPTRIYPKVNYPVSITVKANQDYSGKITDIVPTNFKIMDVSGKGEAKDKKDFQLIEWNVNWQKGQTYKLSYTIDFPDIAPEFYLIGPLHIGDFSEGRSWQIASDGLFAKVQEAHNTAASGLSVTATFGVTATTNHLLVLICSRPASASFNTPTGWTRAFRNSTGTPRIYFYYRLAPAGFTSVACGTSTNSSEIAAQLIEFSGNSTSGYFDKQVSSTGSTGCNSGAHQSTNTNLTATNPDELLVSAFASTNNGVTISSHNTVSGAGSSGFDDTETGGFSGSSGTYDSGWGESVNNPQVAQHDVATYSGAATRCSNGLVAFNSTISISQGSYRFFDNVNSFTPVTAFNGAAVNTPITLTSPNTPFRLRLLLDVDSPSGNTMGLQSGDFVLQYASKPSGGCSTIADSDWQPITTAVASESATPIAYYPNRSTNGSGFNIITSGLDPTDVGYTTSYQSYYEDDNTSAGPAGDVAPGDITNDQSAIANNFAGLWDFSLVDATDGSDGATYCLEMANSGGGQLDAYRNGTYPEVTLYQSGTIIQGGTTLDSGTTVQ
jgi:hypothetical protein